MAEAPAEPQAQAKPEEGSAGPAPPTALEQLAASAALIDKAVRQKETRALFGKVLRQTTATRRGLTAGDLRTFLRRTLPPGSPALTALLPYLGTEVGPAAHHACSAPLPRAAPCRPLPAGRRAPAA